MNNQLDGLTRGDIKAVSVDVFGSLIFLKYRDWREFYEDLFGMAKTKGIIDEKLQPRELANIRMLMDRFAKEGAIGGGALAPITLEEIYAHLPFFIAQKSEIMALECAQLKKSVFPNDILHRQITQIFDTGKKVVLISDTVYSREYLMELLNEVGIDFSCFHELYLACEPKGKKQNGLVFKTIINDLDLSADELLHVGKDLDDDVLRPRRMGILTGHCDLVTSRTNISLEAERLVMGSLCPEIYMLRKNTAENRPTKTIGDRFWYAFGAAMMGPVLTAFSDWVITQAMKNGIRVIYTLMREGALLEPMLNKAALKAGYRCEIKPLYISRQVVRFSGFSTVNERLLQRVMLRKGMTLKRVFELLGLEAYADGYAEYLEMDYYQYRAIRRGPRTLYQELIDFFLTKTLAEKIFHLLNQSNELCTRYLIQEGLLEQSLTVDIGYSATIQRGMNALLRQQGSPHLHLLLFASDVPTLHANIFADPGHPDTIDIVGFFDTYGAKSEFVVPIYERNRPFELLMMDDRGTTTGYLDQNGVIKPLLKTMPSMTRQQLHDIKLAQEGVLAFQDAFYANRCTSDLTIDKEQLLKTVYRVLRHPSYEEAFHLGRMLFDENNGADFISAICDPSDIEMAAKEGLDKLIKKKNRRNILWPEGLNAQANRDFSAGNFLRLKSELEEQCWLLVREVLRDGLESVIVCGIGEAGRLIVLYLRLCGITTESYADNNVLAHGMVLDGILVKPINADFLTNRYIVSSFQHRNQLSRQIRELKGGACHIYTF